MQTIITRLREPSTYAGIAALLGMAGVAVTVVLQSLQRAVNGTSRR